MIVREDFKTRQDGVKLIKSYSDKDVHILKIGTSEVYSSAIDVEDSGYEYEETTIAIERDDNNEVVKPTAEQVAEFLADYNQRTDISDDEALESLVFIYSWESYIGKELTANMVVEYEGKAWRVKQTHTALEVYPPSLDTASLYEVIDIAHEGTADDPIPYSGNMVLEAGKYYVQDGVTYLCTRDSGIAVHHALSELVGVYVVVSD